MSSKKKQSEGIALLSMYNDDEDEEEMEDLEEEEQRHQNQEDEGNREAKNLVEDSRMNGGDDAVAGDETSTSLQPHVNSLAASGSRRRGRGRLTIVDYGHDEVAMSPEPEVL